MPRDADVELFRRHWPEASVPAGLAERIVANATRLPQRVSLKARIAGLFRLPEERWPLAIAYPGAAFAAILLMIGLYSTQLNSVSTEEDVDVDLLILEMLNDDDSF